MKLCLVVFTFILHIFGAHLLIVPDEIPTILSVIYSNIPVLKKGTDSRLGWGFRLGDRADFQILVELGPQTYTQPLANQGDSSNKRNTLNTLSDTLYAQRQRDKQQKQEKQEKEKEISEGGKWLETWSKSVREKPAEAEAQEVPPGAKPGIAVGEIDAKSVIPDDATLKLLELHKEKQVTTESESTTKSE
ncbi:uncharacterized protein LOC123008739 [Tribolium madens]|uniref:uncharacterized protein LOC123008739 n=1 Tax=Tribolium madens TaxID=41895 RepID=UPI001CF742C1|nr:uncharacterized protein LOC123008739 [Tribolium madens]